MNRHCFIFFLMCLAFLAGGQIERGLVAKYSFNAGNANDEVGDNHAKTIGVSPAADRFGNPRSAYYLQGNYHSYLNLGTSHKLKPIAATISLWVNIDKAVQKGSGVPFNPIIITKSRPGSDFMEAYFMGIEINTYKINVNTALNDSIGVNITSSDSIPIYKWHHLVFAYDDRYSWLYVDGVLQNDNKPAVKNFRTQFLETDSVVVGNMANLKNNRCLSGTVDDIFIYDRVLSQAEVDELYNAPDPDKNHIYRTWFYRALMLLAALAVVTWLTIKRYKKALEKEKEKNRVNMRLIELETKAVRTQMNPHFMFNSLNTLQRFILEEDTRGAHVYLAKFSKLLRKILESSTAESISLKEEMEILDGYVEVERLRFNNSFDYSITSSIPDPEKCYIPFLLIQPFVENAIWHGLLPVKGDKLLTITFAGSGERTISCIIEDNGVGREFSATQKDPLKKKSLALDFIKQRLELLERSTGIKCAFKIIDKKDEQGNSTGTRVEIGIPKLNLP